MIDLTKPLRTRDGHPVKVLDYKRRGKWPFVGVIIHDEDDELEAWGEGGWARSEDYPHSNDLVNEGEELEKLTAEQEWEWKVVRNVIRYLTN